MLVRRAVRTGEPSWPGKALQRFKDASNMTDRVGALSALADAHSELAEAALQRFYADVFGWRFDTNSPGGYGMVRQPNGLSGGVGAAPVGQPGGVTFYVQAEDAQEALRRVDRAREELIAAQNDMCSTLDGANDYVRSIFTGIYRSG